MIEPEAKLAEPARVRIEPDPRDHQMLLYRVARGDRAALASLYAEFAPLMLGLAFRIVRDNKDAEDLIHDVFVEAWKRAGDYDPARATVKSWLLMMVRSRSLDRVRSAHYRQVTSVASVPDVAATSNDVELGERDRLHGALMRLTPEQRAVLELGYFEGLSSREIASVLGVPIGTVKSRVAAALSQLRVLLGQSGESAGQS